MSSFFHDLRYALRSLRKSPGFAITVVATLALGIGANTAIFTLVHAILLRSLPVADPAQLYRIGDNNQCCVDGGFQNDTGDYAMVFFAAIAAFIPARRAASIEPMDALRAE